MSSDLAGNRTFCCCRKIFCRFSLRCSRACPNQSKLRACLPGPCAPPRPRRPCAPPHAYRPRQPCAPPPPRLTHDGRWRSGWAPPSLRRSSPTSSFPLLLGLRGLLLGLGPGRLLSSVNLHILLLLLGLRGLLLGLGLWPCLVLSKNSFLSSALDCFLLVPLT
jgi:hypothetical protein